MIFDSSKVLGLVNSRDDGNVSTDSIIHEETRPLIESVAAALCSNSSSQLNFDDLVQEGHLKLQQLLVNNSFRSDRGTLYSFLSFVLKNTMIDSIRKSAKEVSLGDMPEYECALHTVIEDRSYYSVRPQLTYEHFADTLDDLFAYIIDRFPSMPDYVALLDASSYIVTALHESVYYKDSGIKRTLCFMYDFSSELSKILLRSVYMFLRLYVSNNIRFPDDPSKFICLNPSYEMTNIPDMALLIGIVDMNVLLSTVVDMNIAL